MALLSLVSRCFIDSDIKFKYGFLPQKMVKSKKDRNRYDGSGLS